MTPAALSSRLLPTATKKSTLSPSDNLSPIRSSACVSRILRVIWPNVCPVGCLLPAQMRDCLKVVVEDDREARQRPKAATAAERHPAGAFFQSVFSLSAGMAPCVLAGHVSPHRTAHLAGIGAARHAPRRAAQSPHCAAGRRRRAARRDAAARPGDRPGVAIARACLHGGVPQPQSCECAIG